MEDKIYSRMRIRLPKLRFGNLPSKKRNRKKGFAYEVTFIIIIAIITVVLIIKASSPIIDKICEDVAMSKATMVSNKKATEVMANYTYEDLINIHRDNSGNITMLQSNIVTINSITSDIAVKIQENLEQDKDSISSVKLRKFYRSKNIIWIRP